MMSILTRLEEEGTLPDDETEDYAAPAREPFPIHSVTLERFTNPGGRPRHVASREFCDGPGKSISEDAFRRVREEAPSIEHRREPCNVDGFSIAHKGTDWGNGVICVWEDFSGRVVGGQSGGVPYVMPEFRGLKLGREVQLRAFESGLKTVDSGSFFSPEGLASRQSAHRFAVTRAVANGLEVSDEVLADYPELERISAPAFR